MATELLGPDAEVEVDTDEAFLELVCADDDLLRAEFEAIINASWPAAPCHSARVPSPHPREPRRGSQSVTATLEPSDRRDRDSGDRGRQRSPPRKPGRVGPERALNTTRSRGR
ncbi:MAG TPA: hypothetical protein VFN43_03805 [Humibacillus sp.]|nr:hypothetical protein [Humibacillus sp.]